MKHSWFLLLFIAAAFLAILLLAKPFSNRIIKEEEKKIEKSIPARQMLFKMKIKSLAFEHNGSIPSKYTCDGENVSPPLTIEAVPEHTKSLVLIVDDPDAPSKTWVHWVVYNIDPSIRTIEKNTVPEGSVLGITDFCSPGYDGPCPPRDTHRYFFKLYALDTVLTRSEDINKENVEHAMDGHILDQAELIGLYKR